MKNQIKVTAIMLAALIFIGMNTQSAFAMQANPPVLSGIELGYNKTDIEYVKCKLNEPFAYDHNNYTATVDQSYTASMFVTPFLDKDHEGSLIRIDGIYANCGERYRIEMKMGDNPVQISVTSIDGSVNTYNLIIIRKDLSEVYVSELIAEGVWRIKDFGGFVGNEDMYLFIGEKKALLFDTGMGKGDLAGYVRKLTNLPLEVAISHGARDHHGQNDQFKNNKVYYPEKDINSLPATIDRSKYVLVREGDRIDIGGRVFEVIDLPGHSPGHVVYLDRGHNLAFTADILGSGDKVYMQGNNRTSMETYLTGLRHFEDKVKGLNGLTLLVGHSFQTKTPLTGVAGLQMITDMRILAEKLIKGEIIGKLVFSTRNGVTTTMREAYFGLAGMYYNPGL
jgi:glyoxylase-like metal-dependent hydrolase (beta-lactamase superfamily II)